MKRTLLCLGLALPVGVLWACGGDVDDDQPVDGGGSETSTSDHTAPDAGSPGLVCGDAKIPPPPRALVIQGSIATPVSELAVVNLTTGTVDGRLPFEGGFGYTSTVGTDPYLLDGQKDIVTRLDPCEPWKAVGSWDVHGDDVLPDSLDNANPFAVAQTASNKAYVLRYNRNQIAIIDPSRPGTRPTGWVDLSSLKQAGDTQSIEMTGAAYVPSKKRLYVLLANTDLAKVVENGYAILCTDLESSIIAIDVETDAVVSLGGTAPGGGIALEGYNATLGSPLVYDAASDRLLMLHAGCNVALGDGGAGDITRRRVEQVDLATGAVKTVLPLDTQPFPSSFAFASAEHGAVAFSFAGYVFDPRAGTLGSEIQDGMDFIASDGRGAFVGSRQRYSDDGGAGPLEIVGVPVTDAVPTVVTQDPFTQSGGYVSGVEAWPHP